MITVNEAMALQKAIQSRLHQLRSLRNDVAVRRDTRWIGVSERDKQETIEPQFDVKEVDKKVTELELVLFKIDAAIKQSNALTKLELVLDAEKLLSPLT